MTRLEVGSLHRVQKKLIHVQAGTKPTEKQVPVHPGKHRLSRGAEVAVQESVIQPAKGQVKGLGSQRSAPSQVAVPRKVWPPGCQAKERADGGRLTSPSTCAGDVLPPPFC